MMTAAFFTSPLMKWILLGGLSLLCIIMSTFTGLALCIVSVVTRPTRKAKRTSLSPALFDTPVEDITFVSANSEHLVNGQYIASPGASTTVLVCSGYRRSMREVADMAQHLWQAGHHVLLFEYYGHGQVNGTRVTLGYREVQDFLGAVAYAKQRAPQTRLGALGYSMGAAVTILGSAHTDAVEALILDSAFATQWRAIEMKVRHLLRLSPNTPLVLLSVLYGITDLLLGLLMGYRLRQVEPVRSIASLAPRPIFIIHGLADSVVSPQDAYLLYEAAQSPKELWLLPGTKHIRAYYTARTTYTERVLQFFHQHLSPSVVVPLSVALTSQREQEVCLP